jgi:putative N6-adenine-specific DNA methylase
VIIIAKTLKGLEEVLTKEISDLGGTNIEKLTRAVKYEGDDALLYKSCLLLRTAIRIQKFMGEYKVSSYDDIYNKIKKMPWETLFTIKDTFAIRAVTFSNQMNHSMFLGQKVKDGIVDRFYSKFDKRPNINPVSPDFWVDIHVRDNQMMTVSIDASGDPLNMRGYRIYPVEAPLNEVLAAGLIKLSGWQPTQKFIDPMCGSGTLAIEAALIAADLPPHTKSRKFGFMNWKDFDKTAYEKIKSEAYSQKDRIPTFKIKAKDKSLQSLKAAETNAKEAGIASYIDFERKDFFNTEKFEDHVAITNPPYDERLKLEEATDFYSKIGDQLKKYYINSTFYIVSSNIEALKSIGLKPNKRTHVLNGGLEAEFQKYEIYEGSQRV